MNEAFQVIRQGGKVISVAGPIDEEIAKMFGMADYKLPKELTKPISAKNATYKYIFMHPNGADLNEIKSLVEDEKIKPIIDKVYSFSQSIEAFIHLASGRAKGKIVIKIS